MARRHPNTVAGTGSAALVALWELLHPHPAVALAFSAAGVLLIARHHAADQAVRSAAILTVPALTATLHASGPHGDLRSVEVLMVLLMVGLGALGARRPTPHDAAPRQMAGVDE